MPLQAGTKLGSYEILEQIGAGAMGEVYKASDPRLERPVAIKVLPPQFAEDPEIRQRFEREAQAIASLNHPHICTVYDVGSQDGVDYFVMELLEGETLAVRLARGPLEMDETLRVAVAIADALDKAHRQGITHRDLKPSNVMLSTTGPKLLDFGLAKLKQPSQPSISQSTFPTRSAHATVQGTLLGTIQYMAPEQLDGKEADARTDIFAFGAVLYEMVTGKKAFEGISQATLISAIVTAEPKSISKVQPMAPPALDYVVKRCLAKDPKQRVQTAWDLMGQLQWIAEGGTQIGVPVPVTALRRKRYQVVWTAAGIAALLAVAMVWPTYLYLRGEALPQEMRFVESGVSLNGAAPFVVSPDGRWIAMTGRGPSGNALFVRPVGSVTATRLAGTDGVAISHEFWSWDSKSIAFFADGKLKSVDVAGGPPRNICNVKDTTNNAPGGGSWNKDGVILFGSDNILYRVLAAGGEAEAITELGKQETKHWWPQFLPDGKHYLFRVQSSETMNNAIVAGLLGSKERKVVLPAESKGIYVELGYLVFQRNGSVFAQVFDTKSLTLRGEAIRVADPIGFNPTYAAFDASQNGRVLTYRTGDNGGATGSSTSVPDRPLIWVDRSGRKLSQVGVPGGYLGVDLSPDGKKLAVHRHEGSGGDIWIYDLAKADAQVQKLTFDAAQDNSSPIWSPDGTKIAFASRRNDKWGIYTKLADNTAREELIIESEVGKMPMSWSPDGKFIVYWVSERDQWAVPLTGDKKPIPLLKTPAIEVNPTISPDGKWLAYSSNETAGIFQIYIQPFPDGPARWQITTTESGGGYFPRWRRDGKELYFATAAGGVLQATGGNAGGGNMMAVDISVEGSSIKAGVPHALFPSGFVNDAHQGTGLQMFAYQAYAVSADGKQFLIPQRNSVGNTNTLADDLAKFADTGGAPTGSPDSNAITVVLNWASKLTPK